MLRGHPRRGGVRVQTGRGVEVEHSRSVSAGGADTGLEPESGEEGENVEDVMAAVDTGYPQRD